MEEHPGNKLTADLAMQFIDLGYTWKIDGKSVIPSEEDIAKVLDKCVAELYAEDMEDGATLILTTDHLVIKRDAGHIDVYLRMGEYDEPHVHTPPQ